MAKIVFFLYIIWFAVLAINRQSVRGSRIPSNPRSKANNLQHVSSWELLGQRGDEAFLWLAQSELVHHWFETRSEAKAKIFEWIEALYDRIRSHSTLGFMPPEQYERMAKVA